jgi:Class III cytochrome C family.
MQNNKLGCLSTTGIFATLITLFAIVGIAFASGGQMFSAGELNAELGQSYGGVNSHAQINECKACHTAPWETATMADRCASCHTDIAAQMFDVAKLHGAITKQNPNLACRDCHPEHRGATAALVDMNGGNFPHEALGYSLSGHQFKATREAFTCDDCHHGDVTTFASDSCQTCHRQMDIAFTQAHTLSFGTDCLACHDGVDKYGDDFNHSAFVFQLNGNHADGSCSKCHLDARTVLDLQSAPQDCFSCHSSSDPHVGRFGQDCAACHTPDGWKPAKFDHNLAAFKLEGEHAEVACADCHKNDVYQGVPSDCYSCHQKDDEHNGQFGTDCSACHTPNDWEDATFDHNLSAFKLDGAHTQVRCEQCHQNGVFKGTPSACISCHADPAFHAGAFGADCVSCHNTSNWNQAGFNLAHPEPSVDEGGSGITHGGATCRQCHPSTLQQAACTDCHDSNNPGDGEGGDD